MTGQGDVAGRLMETAARWAVTLAPCDCTGRGGCCRLHHTDGRKCASGCVGPVALRDLAVRVAR